MNGFEVSSDDRALFVFTHPDDELVLAAFIRSLVANLIPVHVCWTHSTPLREKESRAVLALLGVGQDCLTFFDAPDGHVLEAVPNLLPLLRRVFDTFSPTRVYVNAFEQGHIDHDATNFLVNMCYSGPVYEAPLYHTYLKKVPVLNRFTTPDGESILALSKDDISLKRRLVTMYPSQTVRRNMRLYTILRLLTFSKPELFETERCRLQTHRDFLRPNHTNEIAEKIEKCELWKRWVSVIRTMISSSSD